MMEKRALVVSIHDVSPRTQPAVTRMLAELAALGVARTSLLVIPDHHGRGHFNADPACVRWLQDLEQAGHEIVIHGYSHRRAAKPGDTGRSKLVTEFYTAGEGEFFDLGQTTATALLERARGEFAAARLHPVGFIAPAWLLSADAERALLAGGFRYTTRLRTFHHLATGRVEHCQSLVWSVRAAWRRVISLGWNRFLFARASCEPLLRISLHPPDLDHPRIWRQICALTRCAAAQREATTYAAWADRAGAV